MKNWIGTIVLVLLAACGTNKVTGPACSPDCTPSPTPTATPTGSPTPSPTGSPTATPTPDPNCNFDGLCGARENIFNCTDCACPTPAPVLADNFEPNETPDVAKPIGFGPTTASLDSNTDEDWYSVIVPRTQPIRIEVREVLSLSVEYELWAILPGTMPGTTRTEKFCGRHVGLSPDRPCTEAVCARDDFAAACQYLVASDGSLAITVLVRIYHQTFAPTPTNYTLAITGECGG